LMPARIRADFRRCNPSHLQAFFPIEGKMYATACPVSAKADTALRANRSVNPQNSSGH
jgi:hypothetical protein